MAGTHLVISKKIICSVAQTLFPLSLKSEFNLHPRWLSEYSKRIYTYIILPEIGVRTLTEFILGFVEDWGIWGVLLSLFIEGSAFPFIGTFFNVTVGLILDLSWLEIVWISLLGSFLYAIGSYIPYFIGYKLGNSVENRMSPAKKESLAKAKASFSKHGVWSVAISSPLHLGNVVPFLAGMSNMNLRLYTLLTMLGIAPSTFLLLSIGRFYPGDTETIINKITDYQTILLISLALITITYLGLKWVRGTGTLSQNFRKILKGSKRSKKSF